MSDIKKRQKIIQDVRKNTDFRDFLKEIVSLRTLGFYRNGGHPSIYADTDRVKGVISHNDFEEKRDDLLKNGLDYNFSNTFFENFKILFQNIEQPPTWLFEECENCDFSDQTVASKNCYLSYVVITGCENILYSLSVKENSRNVLNSVLTRDNCENIYFSVGIIKSFKIFYSNYTQNSSNIRFSSNMIGCHECIFCDNLENQSYCINNKKLEKEEYFNQKEKILSQKEKYLEWHSNLQVKGNNIASKNISGNFNIQCEDIQDGYCNYQVKGAKNAILIGGKDSASNIYDCFLNTPPQDHYYGTFSAGYGDHIYNSYHIKGGSNVYYSVCLENSSYCIGCLGLRNKQFCIFNKQYTKEERFELANKIFEQMNEDGILGKFFPGNINPFYFNDTVAYLIDDSFTKEEITAEGYLRRDEEIKVDIPEGSQIVYTNENTKQQILKKMGSERKNAEDKIKILSDFQYFDKKGNRIIDPNILKKVIRDEKGNSYRIVKMEYDFLMKYGLPLPEIHWLDRIKLGFKFK